MQYDSKEPPPKASPAPLPYPPVPTATKSLSEEEFHARYLEQQRRRQCSGCGEDELPY